MYNLVFWNNFQKNKKKTTTLLSFITPTLDFVVGPTLSLLVDNQYKFQKSAGPGPKTSNSPDRSFWIGLSDVVTEGIYVWNSTGNTTTYTNWGSGQPNNTNGSEHCTLANMSEDGQWHDVTCTFSGSDSMCEKTITKPQIGKMT